MTALVVSDFVGEDVGELGLVLGAQNHPCPHLHGAVRRHAGVEVRGLNDIEANVAAVFGGQFADEFANISVELRVMHDAARRVQALLHAVHMHPEPRFVGVQRRPLARRDVGQSAGRGARGERQTRCQQHMGGARAGVHSGKSANKRSTALRAGPGVRRSPTPLINWLNHTTSPL